MLGALKVDLQEYAFNAAHLRKWFLQHDAGIVVWTGDMKAATDAELCGGTPDKALWGCVRIHTHT